MAAPSVSYKRIAKRMRTTWWLPALVATALLATACKRNFFDPQKVEEILTVSFNNDAVDPTHNWLLTDDWSVTVAANVSGIQRIEVLSDNPFESMQSEVLAVWNNVTEGASVTLGYTTPKQQAEVYVAAVTQDGAYRVVAITPGTNRVDFRTADIITGSKLKSVPTRQEVVYCYCNTYPTPSKTWGYNDLVMRLSKEIVDARTLRVNVTLAALGSQTQMAGALHLGGVMYEAVDNVQQTPAVGFARYKDLARTIIKDNTPLLKSRSGEAVINLFDDAHAAFYMRKESNGNYGHYLFNVAHNSTVANVMEHATTTVSYDITFKQEGMVEHIGFQQLDPFIVYSYNSAPWEIHKYSFKFSEVLFDYYSGNPTDYNNGFTWVLEIPYTFFRWPLNGQSMGSYKNGALYGAYQQPYHSFGEWGANKAEAIDWYKYPNTSMVY